MGKDNVRKTMVAGFRVFRLNLGNKTITEAAGGCGWKKHGEYPTKAAAQRAFDELMKNDRNLEG